MKIFYGAKWWFKLFPLAWGMDATTIGKWIIFRKEKADVSDRLFRHELQHVYQLEREGIKFPFKYLWYRITKGYRNNPYEVEAYKIWETPLTDEERALKEKGG